MKPYQHIQYILQTILHDCIKVSVNLCIFTANDPRWKSNNVDLCDDIFCSKCYQSGRAGNIKISKISDSYYNYYDHFTKQWRLIALLPKVYCYAIDHSFEPVYYDIDFDLWDPSYRKCHPWGLRNPADETTFLEIKDLPVYVLHSEHNSKDIQKLDDLGYKTVHWFSHAFLCSEYYFKMYSNLEIVKNYRARPINHAWINANRLLRQHRTDFLEMLDLDKGCYSFLNPDPNGLTYDGPVPAYSFDSHENHSAEISITDLTPWNTSFLHVVSETVWQDKIHFTEKVFKPIVLHQPFVVLQAPGSLAYLRSYGFRTFGDWWDESYDTIEDPQQRMQAIADIVNAIGNKSLEELETMRMEMASVLEHNFRHFYENIPAICLDELRKGIANL